MQWYGRAGPGDWPLHRLKVHIPVAAMAFLCAHAPQSSEGGGEVSLKGTVQTVRKMRFVNAGGLRSLYEPPCFTEVEAFRLQLLHELQNQRGLTNDVQDYCGLVGPLASGTIRTDLWLPLPAAEGQTFADFASRSSVSSQRWMSAVLATPPVLDRAAADSILPSVDSFHVAPSDITLQALIARNKSSRTLADAFLRGPTLATFNAVCNVVRSLQPPAGGQGSGGGRKRR